MRTVFYLRSAILLSLSVNAFSQGQPVHFVGCNLSEGKSMADVMEYAEKWRATLEPNDPYEAWIMTPTFTSDPNTPDFYWVGAWESMSDMGKGWDAYQANEKAAAVDREFQGSVTCDTNTLWSSTQIKES